MNPNSVTIRKGEAADAARLAGFNRAMARETEDMELDPEIALAGARRMLDDPALGFYLVAESGGEVVAALMITSEWSDWRNGRFWWIQSVYVVPEWRRQGLYSRLYRAVKELAAKDGGVCGYRLYVERENTRAQAAYRKAGMHQTPYQMYEEAAD